MAIRVDPSAPERPRLEKINAKADENGFLRLPSGSAVPLSASDLERHAYCPLSWYLARAGIQAVGSAVKIGQIRHKRIHDSYTELADLQNSRRKEGVIWTWWISIVTILFVEGLVFLRIDQFGNTRAIGSGLVALSLAWLLISILLIILPWRDVRNEMINAHMMDDEDPVNQLAGPVLDSSFLEDPKMGGWGSAGSVEMTTLLAAIGLAIHGIAILAATERLLLAFILALFAMVWNGLSAWRLHRFLQNDLEVRHLSGHLDVEDHAIVTYSDDEKTAGLLFDERTGLRGRPDQILRVEDGFIPVEQKTGRVPKEPHQSHKIQLLAYIRLIEATTGKAPTMGVLRYGEHDAHLITWDEDAKKVLEHEIREVQSALVSGMASRNHEQVGKCRSCSRFRACPERLIEE